VTIAKIRPLNGRGRRKGKGSGLKLNNYCRVVSALVIIVFLRFSNSSAPIGQAAPISDSSNSIVGRTIIELDKSEIGLKYDRKTEILY
jgi:hypothetical protein